MDSSPSETPLTERKVVRRGLMAGLAGLGAAALLKVTGAGKAAPAEAAAALLYPAAPGDAATVNTGYATTNLVNAAGATTALAPLLRVSQAGVTANVVRHAINATAGGTNSIGVQAIASPGADGVGVLGTGGPAIGGGAGGWGAICCRWRRKQRHRWCRSRGQRRRLRQRHRRYRGARLWWIL